MTTESATNLERAARTFIARRDRTAHPDGNFDKAGRWYPSEAETCDCCSSVRSPSQGAPVLVHGPLPHHEARRQPSTASASPTCAAKCAASTQSAGQSEP